jgi:hypothetical protein
MICSYCGGLVTWRGPLSNLTHTQCENCGRQNCQEVAPLPFDDDWAPNPNDDQGEDRPNDPHDDLTPGADSTDRAGVALPAAGWIPMSERRPERGQLIVKRWRSNGAVWAGVYAATDKDSSFDEWVALPTAGVAGRDPQTIPPSTPDGADR